MYLSLFAFSACCAADLHVKHVKQYLFLKVSMQVASQSKHLACLNENSGLLPSPLSSPVGSRIDSIPTLYSALLISMRTQCLSNLPLTLQDRAWCSMASIWPPQLHLHGWYMGAQTLYVTAIWGCHHWGVSHWGYGGCMPHFWAEQRPRDELWTLASLCPACGW